MKNEAMSGGRIRSPRSVRQNGGSSFGKVPVGQARSGCFGILCSGALCLGIGCSLEPIFVGFACSWSKVISSRRQLFGIDRFCSLDSRLMAKAVFPYRAHRVWRALMLEAIQRKHLTNHAVNEDTELESVTRSPIVMDAPSRA